VVRDGVRWGGRGKMSKGIDICLDSVKLNPSQAAVLYICVCRVLVTIFPQNSLHGYAWEWTRFLIGLRFLIY
jgi:hypothetical protein